MQNLEGQTRYIVGAEVPKWRLHHNCYNRLVYKDRFDLTLGLTRKFIWGLASTPPPPPLVRPRVKLLRNIA